MAGAGCHRVLALFSIDKNTRLRRLLDGSLDRKFTLLLYHSPDLMPEAVELGVDLYLGGHTHGGQIRLPFFGALISSCGSYPPDLSKEIGGKLLTLYSLLLPRNPPNF